MVCVCLGMLESVCLCVYSSICVVERQMEKEMIGDRDRERGIDLRWEMERGE